MHVLIISPIYFGEIQIILFLFSHIFIEGYLVFICQSVPYFVPPARWIEWIPIYKRPLSSLVHSVFTNKVFHVLHTEGSIRQIKPYSWSCIDCDVKLETASRREHKSSMSISPQSWRGNNLSTAYQAVINWMIKTLPIETI